MWRALIILAGLVSTLDAYADGKTKQMLTGYQREARNCKIQGDGVDKVLAGATKMADEDGTNDELTADIIQLRAAKEAVTPYCAELAGMIELLSADPAATYKSLEAQIAERSKKIGALRKTFKAAVDGAAPIIRRLVPRINKRNAQAGPPKPQETKPEPKPHETAIKPEPPKPQETAPKPEPPKPQETKPVPPKPEPPKPVPPPAPKPVPPPAPIVMTDGPTTTMAVRAFSGGTCDDQAKRITAKPGQTWDREPPKKRAVGNLAWLTGARWRTSYISGDRFIQIACVPTKTGGYMLTLDEPNAQRPPRDVLDVAARALTATAKP